VTDLSARLACAAGSDQRACAQAFVLRFAERAFRRPLEAADRDGVTALFAAGARTSVGDGVRLVIEGVLQSPSFLYRTELGAAAGQAVALTPYEVASALSFFLLDSLPDPELLAAAADGSLASAEGVAHQVDRLVALPRVRENLGRILLKWSGLGAGVTTELAADQFPTYDENLRRSLETEAARFFGELLAGGASVADMLTARQTFVDQRLATLYGVPHAGADAAAFLPVTLPEGERAGLLTQAAFLVSKARGEPIVHRGKWVREELLCGDIPSPPPNVNTDPPEGEDLTARQFSQRRMASGTCGPCHGLMDGVGLTFAHYDPLGRYITRDEKGAPVDASGDVTDTDFDGPVPDALALVRKLAASNQVRGCVETRMLTYALGRDVADNACEQKRVDARISAGGGRLLDLMAAIAAGPGLRTRQGGER
jgi:hypothetical protein